MTEHRNIEGDILEWILPETTERRFKLKSGDALTATPVFRSDSGTLAVAESLQGRWTYKRVGFLNPRITIRVEGEEADLAIYMSNLWGHGVLTLRDGMRYTRRKGSGTPSRPRPR